MFLAVVHALDLLLEFEDPVSSVLANGSEEKCLKCLKKWALLGVLAADKDEHNDFWKDALKDSSSGNGSGSSGSRSRCSSSILT